MNRTRHVLAVVGLVLALLFAPAVSGPVGAATTATPANATETASPAAAQQETSANSTVSIVETSVTDGSSFEYEPGQFDRIENFSVELTGTVTREDDVDSGTVGGDGEAVSVPIAGTTDPTGPAGGEPELTLTAETQTVSSEFRQGNRIVGLYGQRNSEIRITQPPSTIGSIRTRHTTTGGSGAVVDVYIVEGEGPDATYGEGTLVKEGWEVPNREGWQTIDIDEYATNSSTITVEFVTVEAVDSSFGTLADDRQRDGTTRASWSGNLMSAPLPLEVVSAPPSDVSVTADDGANVSFGSFAAGEGETSKSRPIDLSTNATELTVNYTGGGTLQWSLAYTERTESVNPSVSVNGYWLNASRTLAEGETVSFTPNTSWIRQGTNTVAVHLDTSTLSDDAPAPAVDLRYTHDVVVEPTPTPSPTPTPTPTPSPTPDTEDPNDVSGGGGGGGGGGGAPAPSDDDDDDDDGDEVDVNDVENDGDDGDDSDDEGSSGGSGGGGGGGGGGGAGSGGSGGSGGSLAAAESDDASTSTATPTPTPDTAATTSQTSNTPDRTVVTNVSFEPSRISTNVQAVVVVTLRNPQTASDTHRVELELDGQPIETREVTVPARSTVSTQFAFKFTTPGTYTARVDGETATITVVEPEEGTPVVSTSTSTQFPGFTPLTAVLAVVVLSALAWRRRD